jgi:hypothetical protein
MFFVDVIIPVSTSSQTSQTSQTSASSSAEDVSQEKELHEEALHILIESTT